MRSEYHVGDKQKRSVDIVGQFGKTGVEIEKREYNRRID